MLDPKRFNDYKQYFAEFSVVVKGELDAEYSKTAALIAEWDKRKNYAQLKSQLDQQQADHEVAVKQFKKEQANYTAQMTEWHAKLKLNEQDIIKQKAELAAAQAAFVGEKSSHESETKMLRDSLAARHKELDKKMADLESFQLALHNRDMELSAKQEKVTKAMTTLSELRG